jgi:hypothetical protein
MGIFNHVNYKMNCPNCGKDVGDFQTKSFAGYFETIDYWECDNFYSSCDYCNTWIEFTLQRKNTKIPIEKYEMRIEPSEFEESQFTRNDAGKIVSIRGKG